MKGSVQELKDHTCLLCRMGRMGTHVNLKSSEGPIEICLGPSWFVKNKKLFLNPGDHVEVTGSGAPHEGVPILLARELKKNGYRLTLRNAQGISTWSRGARRAA